MVAARTPCGASTVEELAEWLERYPNNALHPGADEVHKRYVDGLIESGGSTAAAAAYRLERLDARQIDLSPSAVVACLVARNEADRVEAWLAHHRRLGVERFLVIDNASTDATVAAFLSQPDVHVWASDLPFSSANFGAAWFDVLLREYGRGHWVVMADADELLWYPDCETRSLVDLCAALDAAGARALGAVLLDMYARGPVRDIRVSSRDPLDLCPYFDRRWCHVMAKDSGPFRNQVGLWGGARRRVFGGARWDYCLNKVPLVRYDLDCILVGGQHATNLRLAPTRAAVLHFKFVSTLAQYAESEFSRGERTAHASEYEAYVEAFAATPDLSLYDPSTSVRFENSATLVELGIMGDGPGLDELAQRAEACMRLAERRAAHGDRPRAIEYHRRAAALLPTSIVPLLRIAQLCHETADTAGASGSFDDLLTRRPHDLSLLEIADHVANRQCSLPGPLSGSEPFHPHGEWLDETGGQLDLLACSSGRPNRPRWATALRALAPLHSRDGVLFDEFVDATFGWPDPLGFERRVYEVPWVGCVHGTPEPPSQLPPFARHGLAALWQVPELQRSLASCVGLFTFSDHAAAWLTQHTDVPVSVVRRPIDPPPVEFAFDRFAHRGDKDLVQLGWWMTRLDSIRRVPVPRSNPLGMRKLRAIEAERRRLSLGLLRMQRLHDAGARAVGARDGDSLAATTDVALRRPAERDGFLANSVVFADLYDANADPIVLACLGAATPVLVNPLPVVVEYLGGDYPLYYGSWEEAAAKAVDLSLIEGAHEHLRAVRVLLTPSAFRASIASSAIYGGLS